MSSTQPPTPSKKIVIGAALLGFLFGLLRRYLAGGKCRIKKDLSQHVVIVTGANTGIGLETARVLARLGATIVLACRDSARTEPVLRELQSQHGQQKAHFIALDLGDFASVRRFATEFKAKFARLDVLINNAGVMAVAKRTLTPDGNEMQLQTNHLGHFLLTGLLLEVLKKVGRT